MTYDDDLDDHMAVPVMLQPALRKFGHTRRREVAQALTEQLHIKIRVEACAESAYRLLCDMTRPLADVMADHEKPNDRLARALIRAATVRQDLTSLAETITAFGGGNDQLRSTHVVDLHETLVDVLSNRLAPFLTRMMQRWHDAGYFDLEEGNSP